MYKTENNEERIAELNGMYLFVFTAIGLISFSIGVIIAYNVGTIFGDGLTPDELAKAKILVLIFVANVSITFPLDIFTYFLTANEKFIFTRGLHLIEIIITPCFLLLVLVLGFKSIGMAVIVLSLIVLKHIIKVYYSFAYCGYKISFNIKSLSMFKEIFVFSSFIFLNILASQMNNSVDKLLIGRYRGTADVAVFGIATQIYTLYHSIASTIASVVKPRVNQLVFSGNNKGLGSLLLQVGRLQFIVLSVILIGFIIFGRQFILLWAGPDFSESYVIALLLMAPLLLSEIQLLSGEVQRAKNLHVFRSIVFFVIALVNLLISIPLCIRYGAIGCVIGTAFSVIAGHVIAMSIYNQRVIGLDIINLYKTMLKFFPALVLPVATGLLLNRFMDIKSFGELVIAGVVFVSVFFGSMWVLGFDAYEKGLITRAVKRLFKRFS